MWLYSLLEVWGWFAPRCPFLTYEIDLQLVYLSYSFHCTNPVIPKKFHNRDSQKLPPQDMPAPLNNFFVFAKFHVIPQSSFCPLYSSPSLPRPHLFHLFLLTSIFLSPFLSLFFLKTRSLCVLLRAADQGMTGMQGALYKVAVLSVVGMTTLRWHTLHMTTATLKTHGFVHFGFVFFLMAFFPCH